MMPVMNGPATLSRLATNPQLRDIPVIVMTSLPENRVTEQVSGYRAFLAKPFTAARVLNMLAAVLASCAP